MKKERIENYTYLDGREIYTGDICTAVVNQREHICVWVRSKYNKEIHDCVPIDFRVGHYLGPINYEQSRYLGNIYDMAGIV